MFSIYCLPDTILRTKDATGREQKALPSKSTFWMERQTLNIKRGDTGVSTVKGAAQRRGPEDTGTEAATCAECSGKSSLLRNTDAEAPGDKQVAGWLVGKASQARGAGAEAMSHGMPGCTGLDKASLATEVTGLTGFPAPDLRLFPLAHTCHLSHPTSAPPAHSRGDSDFRNRSYLWFPHLSNVGSESRKQLCSHYEGETVSRALPCNRRNWAGC